MPCSTTVSDTENNSDKNIEKFVIAHDFLLSSSDSSNEELQYTYFTYLLRKKRMPRVKYYIKNVVDQYTEEEVNICAILI